MTGYDTAPVSPGMPVASLGHQPTSVGDPWVHQPLCKPPHRCTNDQYGAGVLRRRLGKHAITNSGGIVNSQHRTRYVVVALLVCGVLTNSLAMVPELRPGALLLRLTSLPLAATALLLILLRPSEKAAEVGSRERRRWTPWATAVAAFVVGALAWGTLTTVTSNAGGPEFSLDLVEPTQGPQVVPVST